MSSKRVNLRSRLAAEVASAAQEWSAPAGESVAALLKPYLREGETLPDIALVQELLGRLVADKGGRLVASDQVLQENLRGARSLRWQRDDEAAKLRELLRGARFYLDQAGGRGTGAKNGIGHGLSWMAPAHLARVGEEIAEVLLGIKPRRGLSAGALAALADPAALSAGIREQAARLAEAVAQLKPQNAGSIFARGEQTRSLAEAEKVVRRSAALLAALYKLGGHPLFAKKVRPIFRRKPRSRVKKEAAPPPPAPAVPVDDLRDLDWAEIRPVEIKPPEPPRSPAFVRGPRRRRRTSE